MLKPCVAILGLLSLFPIAIRAEEVKPFASFCDQPEVILPALRPDKVISGLLKQLPTGGAVRLVTGNMLIVDWPLPSPQVEHHPDEDETFTQTRLQFAAEESRTGVRLRGAMGLVGYSVSEPSLVIDVTRPEFGQINALLLGLRSKLSASDSPRPVGEEDFVSVATTAIAQIEGGRPPLSYVFDNEIAQRGRHAVATLRPVIEQSKLPKLPYKAVPEGYVLIQQFDVTSDNASVTATIGTGGRCDAGVQVRLKSDRIGWKVCEHTETVC